MPLNDTLTLLKESKIVKRIVSSKFDGVADSYIFKVRTELVNGWLLDYWEHKAPRLRRYSFHVFFNRQMIVRWDKLRIILDWMGFQIISMKEKKLLAQST